MRAVLGIADHYGRGEFVTLGTSGSTFHLLARMSVPLIDPILPSAPYHHEALGMPLPAAEELISRVRASVADHCRRALAEQVTSFGIETIVLQTSPYPALPVTLQEVLASWQLTCAADGMMYREILATCAAEAGIEVERYRRRSDRLGAAAASLAVPRSHVIDILKTLGKQAGSPWRKEHQEAAASALAVLGKHT